MIVELMIYLYIIEIKLEVDRIRSRRIFTYNNMGYPENSN